MSAESPQGEGPTRPRGARQGGGRGSPPFAPLPPFRLQVWREHAASLGLEVPEVLEQVPRTTGTGGPRVRGEGDAPLNRRQVLEALRGPGGPDRPRNPLQSSFCLPGRSRSSSETWRSAGIWSRGFTGSGECTFHAVNIRGSSSRRSAGTRSFSSRWETLRTEGGSSDQRSPVLQVRREAALLGIHGGPGPGKSGPCYRLQLFLMAFASQHIAALRIKV